MRIPLGASLTSSTKALFAAKAIAIICCGLFLFATSVARLSVDIAAFKSNTLDHSWIIGLAATLQEGQVSGRDFFYTYGVLAQVLAWLGTWLNKGQSAVDGFFAVLLCFQSAGIILFGLVLWLIKRVDWKQVALVSLAMALLGALFQYAAFRMILVLLCGVAVQRAMSSSPSSRLVSAAVAGLLCLMAQLVTVELGIQTILVATLTLGTYAIFARFRGLLRRDDLLSPVSYLSMLGMMLGVFVIGNLVISLLFTLSSPAYLHFFDYQRYSLDIIRGYNNTMGIPWRPSARVIGGIAVILLYVTAFVLSNLRRLETSDGYLVFCLLISSWIALKAMTLRSDWGHTTLAAVPLIFLVLLIGSDWLGGSRWRTSWFLALILLFAIWPGASFAALTHGTQILTGELSLSNKLKRIISYHAPLDEYMPAGLAEALPDSSRPMLNFPYQNYIGIGLLRKPMAPVLQAHIAHTEALQEKYIEVLENQTGAFDVVYGMDFLASWPVDNVQHISRVPIIFEYLYRNYELCSAQIFGEGYFLLCPRQQPRDLQAIQLSYTSAQTGRSRIRIDLDEPVSCGLVRLKLRINYPLVAALGRPDALHLQFLSRDTEILQTDVVPVETGKFFQTYVSLIDAPKFYTIFGATPVQSKQWDMLLVSPRVSGLLGVSPAQVNIDKIECIEPDNP